MSLVLLPRGVAMPPRAHVYKSHAGVACPKPGTCQYCDGGLSYCTVCGGLEGALLDWCPGIMLTDEQQEWNYRGNLRRWDKEAQQRLRGR